MPNTPPSPRTRNEYTAVPVTHEAPLDPEDDLEHVQDVPTGTLISSILNITNTILGSGMLAMPAALAGVGLGLGVLMILLSASASAFGLLLLTHVAARAGRQSSFFACSKMTYPSAAVFFDVAIAIKCFGVSVSYLVICGDLLPQVVQGFSPQTSADSIFRAKSFWVTVCILVIAPLSFARKLNSLRYVSAFALLAVVYLLFIVVYFFVVGGAEILPRPGWNDIHWIRIDSKFFTFLPIFVFAFTYIFAVYNELEDNTPPKIQRVVFTSVTTALCVYQVIGVLGYLSFGDAVKSNIIAMYPHSTIVTGGQLAIALLVLLSYPLQCHPCRASLDKVLTCGQISTNPLSRERHASLTLGIMMASYILAIATKNLSTVLSLVGATGSTTICYILPGLFYFKFRENTDGVQGRAWDTMKTASLILAGMGVLIMSTSLTSQVHGIIHGKPGSIGH